jgi:hypothetical protein
MNRSIFALANTVLLAMSAPAGFAAEDVHVPATPEAAASANLIAHAERALSEYVATCSTSDEALAHIFASDAIVEYALAKPGTYLVIEAAPLCANRSGDTAQTRTAAHISSLWIYPTAESNTVFLNYAIDFDDRSPSEPADSEHLALLKMRGDQIVKLRHFGTLSTFEAFLLARAIASSRVTTRD